ncbi:MAG: methyltransferase domain-containing protein, partial [Candidatus Brocadiales bacterium]
MNGLTIKTLCCAILLALATIAMGQKYGARNFFSSERINILETSEAWQKGEEAARILGIKNGDTVACIGIGSGVFALPMAEKAGEEGMVYAQDAHQDILNLIWKQIKSSRTNNIQLVLGKSENPTFPDNSLDVAIMRSTYHETENPVVLLKNIYKELKPDGRLAVIDWSPVMQL